MVNYEVAVQLPDAKRQNIGQWNTADISLATTADTLTIVSNNELTQEQIDALVTKIQSENVKPKFSLDALDSWLVSEPTIQPFASFFPIISRASEKNTVAGYQLMVAVANAQSIPAEIITLVTNKLAELGANI